MWIPNIDEVHLIRLIDMISTLTANELKQWLWEVEYLDVPYLHEVAFLNPSEKLEIVDRQHLHRITNEILHSEAKLERELIMKVLTILDKASVKGVLMDGVVDNIPNVHYDKNELLVNIALILTIPSILALFAIIKHYLN